MRALRITALVTLSLSVLGAGVIYSKNARVGWNDQKTKYRLPNGWSVSPVGDLIELPGDMPGGITFIEGGTKAIVNTCGFHDHSVNLIDLKQKKVLQSLPIDKNWIGLTQTRNGEILTSAAKPSKSEAMHRYKIENGSLTQIADVSIPELTADKTFVSSMIEGKDSTYVLNIQTDEVLKLDSNHNVITKAKVGYRPYGIAESPNADLVAISNWGDKSVSVLDAKTLKELYRLKTGPHPTALVYHPDGRLFVANSGADFISVFSDQEEQERINVGLGFEQSIGTVPISLAFTPNHKTLFVANAGNNCVAKVDVSVQESSHVDGFIPTDRYPALVSVTPDGKTLVIGTAKGKYGPNAGSVVNENTKGLRNKGTAGQYQYVGAQLTGQLAILPIPSDSQLKSFSEMARSNAHSIIKDQPTATNSSLIQKEAFDKIKHVIYVIRENRTYDQVLGDIKKGNGDSSLTIFGEKITPNGHKIANNFVLFDNLYADGECSQAGHQWTDAGYATDYCEKQWVLGYSRRGQVESDSRLTSSPGDYIWARARRVGLSARVYGEYVDVQEDHNSLNNPEMKANPERYGYSESFEKLFANDARDSEKVDDFIRELKEAEKKGKWHNLMVMALPDDHTHGFSPGTLSPRAMVADNDLAIGKLVDAVSHSKFWANTAIFIIQDDAQDGPDHVDSHRTVGYVVSPYTKRGVVDSTHYTTSSMLRTIGLMLGFDPLTQYDAAAMPMHNAFNSVPDLTPFNLVTPLVDLEERNPKKGALANWSKKLDFSDIDKADFDQLNRLLWAGYKPGIPYPTPIRH